MSGLYTHGAVSYGSEPGQGSAAVGDSKKRADLVALKAAAGQVRPEYVFSQQRAYGLVPLAVSSRRYQPRRSDAGSVWLWRWIPALPAGR